MSRGSITCSSLSALGQVSSPATNPGVSRKSISDPGPQVVITWLRRTCPWARAISRSRSAAANVPQQQVDARLDIPQRAVHAELAVVSRMKSVSSMSRRSGLGCPALVALVAQVDRVVLVAVDDRLPGVEQIDDPLLHARGPLPALFLVHRLLQQAAVEQLAQLLLEADADGGELLGAERGLQRRRQVPGETRQGRRRTRDRARVPRTGVTLATSTER